MPCPFRWLPELYLSPKTGGDWDLDSEEVRFADVFLVVLNGDTDRLVCACPFNPLAAPNIASPLLLRSLSLLLSTGVPASDRCASSPAIPESTRSKYDKPPKSLKCGSTAADSLPTVPSFVPP